MAQRMIVCCSRTYEHPCMSSFHANIRTMTCASAYSNLVINARLVLVFTTPPTPNAGIMRPILAKADFAQFFTTCPTLPSGPPILASGLLYKSNPSKCNGVLTNCIAAGVTNCATLAAPTYFFTSSPIYASIFGANTGGRLNEAKIVRQSRTVKSANVGRGTGRFDPALPKSWVNWLSL